MKHIEEKARQYAKENCGYNVNCNIDNTCESCQWFNNHITETQMRTSSEGFIAGYQSALHDNRWRSVEDELPEPNVMVLIKGYVHEPSSNEDDNMQFGWYTPHLGVSDCPMSYWTTETFEIITHWKPIITE